MSESTPIQIHVLSEIRKEHEQDKETIEMNTTGEQFLKGNTVYLRYDEQHELGSVKTTVKIAPEEVMVMRSGAVTMKQRFIQGQKTMTDYATPFGKLQLEINTNSLTIDKTELEDRLVILYDLQIDENEKHVHKLMITYKEDKK
ncbi:DUF1934 domain-containing protein [Metabacillus halosaccharovorans]|uniref:DUF1934 family protein n=1 Tax=Metabacillus halosaccharovorans TaxID=930124 RepID=A0ABT3DFE6_9BACI|nr:DUF1934 family protein [Metabacillus halosaccharovorans]MCV9885772.1 DUF1934 family protein [Metabacillus halosaccharovorans]